MKSKFSRGAAKATLYADQEQVKPGEKRSEFAPGGMVSGPDLPMIPGGETVFSTPEATSTMASNIPVRCAFTRLEPVVQLLPNPKNPKVHPRTQLEVYAKIIREQGWRRAIVISSLSGLIVKGHGAYEAARDVLGVQLVPVDVQDYPSEEAELADLLADNRLAELAETDEAMLDALLCELKDKIDLELAGVLAVLEEPGALEKTQPGSFPITAKLHESYDYVLIFTDNESDFVHLQALCGVQTEQSYKKSGIGLGRAVSMKRFLDALRENHHSLDVPRADDDHAPAGA